jgi:hypothetical protein
MNLSHIGQFFQWLFIPVSWVVPPGWVCLLVIIAAGTIFWWHKPYRKGLWKKSYWLVLAQLLFYPAIMIAGKFFQLDPSYYLMNSKRQTTGFWTIDCLFIISLALSIFWVWWIKGFRWYIFIFVSVLQFLLCSAWLFSGFEITGWP